MKSKEIYCQRGQLIINNKHEKPNAQVAERKAKTVIEVLCAAHCQNQCSFNSEDSETYIQEFMALFIDSFLPREED